MQRKMSLNEVKTAIEENPLVLMVVKTSSCGVCESVQAKVSIMLEPRADVTGVYVYLEDAPSLASEYLVFSSPTVLLFYEGKEVYRTVRFVQFDELDHVLSQYEARLAGA